jgi:V/A-type H+/Na+-transporting ATPase subunit I
MRVDVEKYLFIGAERDRLRFFAEAQKSGVVEFIDPEGRSKKGLPSELHHLLAARKVLRGFAPADQEDLSDLSAADRIAEVVLHLKERLDRLEEEQRLLRQEIARVEVFGDFSTEKLHEVEEFGHRVIQFFFSKRRMAEELAAEPELIYVGSNFGLDYFVSIASERKSYPGLIEMHIDRPVGELRLRYQEIFGEIRLIEQEIKSYEKRYAFLHKRYVDRLNAFNLTEAGNDVEPLFDGHLFAIMGWAPDHKRAELAKLASEFNLVVEQIATDPDERVPTFLENKGWSRVGEDLVHIYDTPSTEDRDPSLWVLCFFAFFFSMIIGDMGYGLILLATSFWVQYKFRGREGLAKRFPRLCILLSCGVIVWGTLTTSFFGIEFPLTSPVKKVSLVDWLVHQKIDYIVDTQGIDYQELAKEYPSLAAYGSGQEMLSEIGLANVKHDFSKLYSSYANNVMIEIALIVGCLHVILSLLRVIDRHWAGIGWIVFIVGAYLWCPSMLKSVSMVNYVLGVSPDAAAKYGLQLVWIGLGLAVVLAFVQHRMGGAVEITKVIQVFADILSYLRLYALGLAGAIMSQTFNMMGEDLGLVFGIIVIIIGHAINIALGIMGGIIHGLRLNFLEWYHWSFAGGGHMFRPLKLEKIQ